MTLRSITTSTTACALALVVLVASPATTFAQSTAEGIEERGMTQISTHMGEMYSEMSSPDDSRAVRDSLRFEPWQMIDEMFFRDDVVFLMRHGPTDWSFRDAKDVAPTDCENQRVMSPEGKWDMQNMGILMASNDVRPSRIIVSEWCRNQETIENLRRGFEAVDPDYNASVNVQTNPALNLLLSLQGAPNVAEMRDIIAAWEGDEDGPLLLISHFTNIEELTDFRVYEGEALIVDPKRDSRVLGYLRLRSSGPDVGHFNAQ